MRNFWTIFAVLFVFALTPMTAEAKRFGGGKSFGQSRQTAPAQPAARPDPGKSAQQGAAANAGKKGMMGGLLGGLLAGGLIAALLGGAFEGIQFMDFVILGLLAFVIFKLMRRRAPAAQQPAPAFPTPTPPVDQRNVTDSLPPARDTLFGNNSGPGASGGGFAASSVPFNLPPNFDMNGFLAGAREHYRTLQDAWNKNDLAKIQEYVTPELYNDLRAERATLQGDQHTEVLFVDAELVRANHSATEAEISIKFSGRYRDVQEGVEEPITDIWHLQRDITRADSPWYIIGIEG